MIWIFSEEIMSDRNISELFRIYLKVNFLVKCLGNQHSFLSEMNLGSRIIRTFLTMNVKMDIIQ